MKGTMMTENEPLAAGDEAASADDEAVDPFTYVAGIPDMVLEVIAKLVEGDGTERDDSKGTTVGLTVTVPGGVVSGQLVSRRRWVKLTEERMTESGVDPESVKFLTELFQALAPPIKKDQQVNFLHFETGTLMTGTSVVNVPGLRVSLADVSSWAMLVPST